MNFDNVPIVTGHDFEQPPAKQTSVSVEIESQRAVQEVQAAMIIAKRFPRDQFAAYSRIMDSCKRPSLAAAAQYAYPRGGTMITGPSIRLAEVLANSWGNIQSGIVELSRSNGVSEVMAYAWDLESNTRKVMQFQIKHIRETKQGAKALEGERDIYELVANQGARRLRACILSVIPGDIVEAAEKKCEETLKKGGEPMEDRIRKMVTAFADFGVTTEMIEKRIGHKMSATIIQELVTLGKIYTSLKDGMSKREDYFDITPDAPNLPSVDTSNEKHTKGRAKPKSAPETQISAPQPEPPAPPSTDVESDKLTCPKGDGTEQVLSSFCVGQCPDREGCPNW